jgi:hypothetical protein
MEMRGEPTSVVESMHEAGAGKLGHADMIARLPIAQNLPGDEGKNGGIDNRGPIPDNSAAWA